MRFAIIAAGEGSRLANEGVPTPKPLVRLNGEPMIERLIRIFAANGADGISVIVNRGMGEVYERLAALKTPVPLHIINKSTPSSMHSFYELSPTLGDGKFCLATVDTVFREDEFAGYIDTFRSSAAAGLMAVTDYIDDEKPLYVETSEDMAITSFRDENYQGSRYVSGGVYCLDGRSIPVLKDAVGAGMSRMRNFQRQLLASGLKLQAWAFSKIIDVDHQEDIRKAERFLVAKQ